jgi:hypothetical protein
MSNNNRFYRERIFLFSKEASFDMAEIEKRLREEVLEVYGDPTDPNIKLLCFAEDAKDHVSNWIAKGDFRRRPGVPIVALSAESIRVSAGFVESDNEPFRPILKWIAKKWPIQIRDEWNHEIVPDFDEFPDMYNVVLPDEVT